MLNDNLTSRQQHHVFYYAVFVEILNFTMCIFSGTVILKFPSRAVHYKNGCMDYLCGNCDYRWEFIKMSDSNFSGLSTDVTINCSFLHVALQSTQR